MTVIPIPESWRSRAMVIRDEDGDESWFDAEELAIANSFVNRKRRREWLLSRVAAKGLAVELEICEEPRRCRVDQRQIDSWFVSLSHCAPYGGAAIDRNAVGIDIEVVRDISERAVHLFLTSDEAADMSRCSLPNRIIHFWCAKEAAWKQRHGEIATLKSVPITLVEEGERGLRFAEVETWAVGDLVVALTLPTS